MTIIRVRVLALLSCALIHSTPLAGQSPVVAGARHTNDVVERGHTLIGELGCVQCHDGAPKLGFAPRLAPDLSQVGDRARGSWLQRFIADPQGTKPGTTMPHVTSPENAEAIAHWLVSRSRRRPRSVAPDLGAAARGDRKFHRIGCVACHAPRGEQAQELTEPTVPLPEPMEEKYALSGLEQFLKDPIRVRPSGRMPHLGLSRKDARDISHFLLQGTVVPGSLNFAYYPKKRETLDVFDPTTEPERTGLTDQFDPRVAARGHDFALRFDGYINIPKDGRYTFEVTSDDGTRLYLNGAVVVDNDGHRRNQKSVTKSGAVDLKSGWQPIELRYFQRVRNTVIDVQWQGPGTAKGPIDPNLLRATARPVQPSSDFVVDMEKARLGEALFRSEGCISCHKAGAATRRPEGVPSITSARSDHGCLSDTPTRPAPDYRLEKSDRAAIRAAVSAVATETSEKTVVDRRLRSFDCYACHERDGIGGPSERRSDWFTSDGHNQGQEGRIPPRITGVGDKLKQPWLERVLADGTSVRPLFHTRMPRFGGHNLDGLAAALVRLDRKPAAVPEVDDDIETQRAAGRKLVGPTGGFNCVACHLFNQREAPTMQMVDLVSVTDRIHEDWFQRWIRDPGSYNPGTRMPEYLAHPEILNGNRDRQFAAIWAYLSDGRKAVLPDGLSRQSLELVVGGEAIVYRGKIRDAGFRGICVGHPELAHFAFDADRLRPAMLWKGRFLNVAAHWRSQSMGRIGPHGSDAIKLPAGRVWARVPKPSGPWPADIADRPPDHTFKGYRLGAKRRPTFLYEVGNVRVEDHSSAREGVDGARIVTRRLKLTTPAPVEDLEHKIAQGKKIEERDGAFVIDDRLTVRIEGTGAYVTGPPGDRTLRLRFSFENGTSEVEVHYQW